MMPPLFLPPRLLPSAPPRARVFPTCRLRAPRAPRPSRPPDRARARAALPRRAFLRLLLAAPLLPLAARAHEEFLDLEPSEPSPHAESRYGWPSSTARFTTATEDDFVAARHVGTGAQDVARMARVYLARAGVTAFVAAYSICGMSMSERQARRTVIPSVYDPAVIARYWGTRPDKVVFRMALFACEIAKLAFTLTAHTLQDRGPDAWAVAVGSRPRSWRFARRGARAERRAVLLREAIIRLGPAVIKLGQAAASRPDLLGPAVIRELQKLQDDIVDYYPTKDAFQLIFDELQATPAALFEQMEIEPVAGASLGMVFKAQVEGTPVAVKVQRPDVAENIALDCFIVRALAHLATRLLGSRTDFTLAVDEYSSRLFEELDYRNELRNMDKFRRLYGDVVGIYIPKSFPKYCARRVLVSEWVDGVKLIDDQARVRPEDLPLVETGIRFALTQLLDNGFLHADMHNGNMLRTKSGYLAYIDFGLVSEVPTSVRESLVCALMHLIHGEYTRLAESFVGLALMRSDDIEVDLPVLSEALREAFEPSNEVLAASRKRGIVNRFNNFTLIGIVGKLLMLGTRFPFVFNDYFLNNLRCLGMLEGLALNADPNFNVLGVVYPYVAKKILTNSRPRYRRTLEGLVIDQYGRMRWSRMDRLLQDVQDTAATTSGKHEEHMMDLIRFSDSRPAALPSGDDESWKESVREGGNENKRAEEIAGPVGTLKRRRRKERAMTTQKNSADLVLGFITSSHGQFLRKYIIQQYTMDMAKRWRRRIDRVTSWRSDAGEGVKPENSSSDSSTGLVGRGRSKYDVLHQMALRATERELSDDEARLRTRLFFRRTPISKRFHVLGRLAPGFVLPVLGTLLGLVVYFLQRVFGLVQEWGQDGEDAFARVGVGAEGNGAVKDERAEGEVRRWSIDEEERRLQSWQPLDSVFLKRTQATPRREASSSSAEAAKSMG